MTCVLSARCFGNLIIEDGTPTTPLTIALTLFGDFNVDNGETEPIWTKNHQGGPSGGPPHKGATGLSSITVTNAQISSVGGDASNRTLADFLAETSGSAAAAMLTTNASTNSDSAHVFKTYKVYFQPSLDGGTTARRWQLNNAIVTSRTLDGPNGGLLTYNFTMTSDQPLMSNIAVPS